MTDVSVLTPSLNQGPFIEDNIRSVLGQEGLVIEHIVQDGGSTDETLDVLRRFADAVEWVSEPDGGQSHALNKALTRATARWVAWHNADDFYLPGGLAALVRHGDKVGADVVYGDNVGVDQEGRVLRSKGHHQFGRRVHRSVLFYAAVIHSGSSIVRRSALPPDPWDTAFRRIMDQEFFLKLASRGAQFNYVTYPAAASRSQPEQMTARPITDFLDEYQTQDERYGIPSSGPPLGKALHRARKLLTGAYWRQFQVEKRFRGRDILWFRDGEGQATFDELLRSCYRGRQHKYQERA